MFAPTEVKMIFRSTPSAMAGCYVLDEKMEQMLTLKIHYCITIQAKCMIEQLAKYRNYEDNRLIQRFTVVMAGICSP